MNGKPTEKCNICGQAMAELHSARILTQYDVRYLHCPNCLFVRTEEPYWLTEAYSQAIAATDTGIVARNLFATRQLTCVLSGMFESGARFLDIAGGTGLLTRLMRDNGFDFYWEDIYCQNVLARGFEAPEGETKYEAVTAFEALEHMEQPLDFIRRCIERSTTGTLLFTTELFQPPTPLRDWWYFSTVTGQHISFFSRPTLQLIAKQLGLRFASHRGLHMLTRLDISESTYKSLLDGESKGMFERIVKNCASLTIPDHALMTQQILRSKDIDDTQLADLTIPALEPTPQVSNRTKWLKRTTQRWKRSMQKRFGGQN